MADNVAITAGSGTTIATDDVAGVHYQQVKLVASTLDSASPLSRAEDAAHTDGEHGILALGVRNYAGAGTDGDYSAFSVASDGNLRVDSHKDQVRIAQQTTTGEITTATTSYIAGDAVGPLFTFANAARASGGSGLITGVTLTDASGIIGAYDVVFFRSSATITTDNSPLNLSAADIRNVVGVVQLPGAIDLGVSNWAGMFNLAVPYDCSGTSLYAVLVCRFGHSFFSVGGATSLELTVFLERN